MSLLLNGERISGIECKSQNVLAATAVANVVRSSLGPVGLDKMLVDDVGDVIVTNDGATILKMLEVEHPAAKVLCELAALQDSEVGDGTTSVVIIAAELLKQALELIKIGMHPTNIISGYRLACREAVKALNDRFCVTSSKLDANYLTNIVKTSICSKVLNAEIDFFSNLIVEAALLVKSSVAVSNSESESENEFKCPIHIINVLKNIGGKMTDSILIKGYALNCTAASDAMPKAIYSSNTTTNNNNTYSVNTNDSVKIALLDMSLQKAKLALGVQILVTDPTKLEEMRKNEIDIVLNRINLLLKSKPNVVLVTGGIDELCMKPFIENKIMAVRRVKKVDMKRIAQFTGATIVSNFSDMDQADESFDASLLGVAESVVQQSIGDNELIVINGKSNLNSNSNGSAQKNLEETTKQAGASIILRGANDSMLDEMERSVHDALCAVKRVIETDYVVAGGGAVEAALSVYLENFATTIATKQQQPIAEFAQALLVIPRVLAANSAFDSTDLVADLRINWYKALRDQNYSRNTVNKQYGLDLVNGKVVDALASGVMEPRVSKVKMLKFATEAAITILRIDDMVRLQPEAKEEPAH